MPSESRLLIVAGVLGGLLGGVLAWNSTGRHHPSVSPHGHRSSQSVADPTAPKGELSAPVPTSSPDAELIQSATNSQSELPAVQPSVSGSTEPPENPTPQDQSCFAAIAWLIPSDPKLAEAACTSGDALSCLGLGEYYQTSKDSHSAIPRSQAYFDRAYSILVLKCHRRDPDACVAIARMHQLKRGIHRDPAAQSALLTRARDLCRTKPGRTCQACSQ
jgi:TPR repeat protein